MTSIPVDKVAEVFVQVADTLVDDFDVIEFLSMVTEHTSELSSATAAGLLLADHKGRLQLMAASNEEARALEMFQAQAVEGPCQDCFRQGEPVVNADLAAASDRWPRFAPRAVEAGFRSVHAFPMRLRGQVIGALNMFGDEPGRMEPDDVRVVQALADIATIGLLQERAVRHGEVLTEQLQTALNSRIGIEQAKGALAQIHDCTPDEAFTLLRDWSRSHHQRLVDVANGVINDPASYADLTRRQ